AAAGRLPERGGAGFLRPFLHGGQGWYAQGDESADPPHPRNRRRHSAAGSQVVDELAGRRGGDGGADCGNVAAEGDEVRADAGTGRGWGGSGGGRDRRECAGGRLPGAVKRGAFAGGRTGTARPGTGGRSPVQVSG